MRASSGGGVGHISDGRIRGHRRSRCGAAAATAAALLVAAVLAAGLTFLALRTGSRPSADSHEPVLAPAVPVSLLPQPSHDELAASEVGGVSRRKRRRQLWVSNVTHLVHAGRSAEWLADSRFHPSSFLSENAVLNETIYCDKPLEAQLTIFYSEPTWICRNIRVGKRRLPFTDTTTRTQDELTMYRRRELELSGPDFSNDVCGRLPDRGNNVFLLCELLLAQLGASFASPPMTSSVHVPFGNCSLPEHERAILVGESAAQAVWYTESKLWPGFVTDIFCSFGLR